MEIAAQAFGCVPEAFVVALAGIWFSDGDPVRAYGVAAFGAFWAALGLVHSPKKLLALIAWALVVALLILECRFIIKQAPPNEPSVQKPASTTTPQTLTPAAPPAAPSAAPPVPASNTPEPPPAPQIISPEDAAIQLGAWSILLPRTNDLVLSYNAFDLALSQWESKAETEDGSAKLAKDLRDEAAKMVAASHRVEMIAKDYPQLGDLVATLSNSPAGQVSTAANALGDALTKKEDDTGEARLVRLRKLAGALRLQMGAMDNWMSNLNRVANLRVRDLSGVK